MSTTVPTFSITKADLRAFQYLKVFQAAIVDTTSRDKTLLKCIGPPTGDSHQKALEVLIDEVEKLTKCEVYLSDDKVSSDEDSPSEDDEDDSDEDLLLYNRRERGMRHQIRAGLEPYGRFSSGGFGGHGKLSLAAPLSGNQDQSMKRKNASDSRNDGHQDKKRRSGEGHNRAQRDRIYAPIQHGTSGVQTKGDRSKLWKTNNTSRIPSANETDGHGPEVLDDTVMNRTALDFKFAKQHDRGKKVKPSTTKKMLPITEPSIPVATRKYGMFTPVPGGIDELSEAGSDNEVFM